MQLGNGMGVNNTYDQVYRLTNATAGTLYNRSYLYTVTGLVDNIVDNIQPSSSQSFIYDDLQGW